MFNEVSFVLWVNDFTLAPNTLYIVTSIALVVWYFRVITSLAGFGKKET